MAPPPQAGRCSSLQLRRSRPNHAGHTYLGSGTCHEQNAQNPDLEDCCRAVGWFRVVSSWVKASNVKTPFAITFSLVSCVPSVRNAAPRFPFLCHVVTWVSCCGTSKDERAVGHSGTGPTGWPPCDPCPLSHIVANLLLLFPHLVEEEEDAPGAHGDSPGWELESP